MRDRSLITGRGLQNGRRRFVQVVPIQKKESVCVRGGAERILATLNGGGGGTQFVVLMQNTIVLAMLKGPAKMFKGEVGPPLNIFACAIPIINDRSLTIYGYPIVGVGIG